MSSALIYKASTQKSNGHLPTTISAATKMLKYQHIAPAPPPTPQALLATANSCDDFKATRKYTPRATNAPYSVDQTQSVQRRNARERNRVKQVNNSFAKLRQHIPQSIIADLTKGGGRGPHKKISKVDTLRIAVEYIRRLQDLVDDLNGGSSYGANVSHAVSCDNMSNLSFCTSSRSSSSSSSLAGSPPPPTPTTSAPPTAQLLLTTPPTTVSSFNYTTHHQQQQSSSTSPLPSYQQQFSAGATTSALLTPVSLHAYNPIDAGCASPTSSFNSSMSFDSGTYEPTSSNNQQQSNNEHLNAHLQLKFEPYDNFQLHEEDCQPDDEEILDYISLWQEQ